jgi:hypothetical protein
MIGPLAWGVGVVSLFLIFLTMAVLSFGETRMFWGITTAVYGFVAYVTTMILIVHGVLD